jgi:hypothetical protein
MNIIPLIVLSISINDGDTSYISHYFSLFSVLSINCLISGSGSCQPSSWKIIITVS